MTCFVWGNVPWKNASIFPLSLFRSAYKRARVLVALASEPCCSSPRWPRSAPPGGWAPAPAAAECGVSPVTVPLGTCHYCICMGSRSPWPARGPSSLTTGPSPWRVSPKPSCASLLSSVSQSNIARLKEAMVSLEVEEGQQTLMTSAEASG